VLEVVLAALAVMCLVMTARRLRWLRTPLPAVSMPGTGFGSRPEPRSRYGKAEAFNRLDSDSDSDREPELSSSGTTSARTPSVSVVVPALNEEESIDWVIENIPAWVSEIVLVDGLSVDGTELVVTDRRADVVIVHQRSRGKGAALRAGFAAASGDIIVMIDADGSTDPREIGSFVSALLAGADFVKGSRNLPGGGSVDFTLLRSLGNFAFVHAANLLFGSRFTDLCYGYCAFWRRDLERLALTADGFEIEMELILSAVKAGLSVVEVPSMELERRAGNSNLNAWKDGKRVLKTLAKERVRTLDPARAAQSRIALAEVELAAHGTEQWVPAGADRRRYLTSDRRLTEERRAGYQGPDRRDLERRSPPERTVRVLYAHHTYEAVVKRRRSNRTLRGGSR
jgi:hypothetical protein